MSQMMVDLVLGKIGPSRFTMAWLGVDSAQTLSDSVLDYMREACESMSILSRPGYK